MNEERLQAYYQLIENLLSCHSGEEPEILAANTELLDADFVQFLEAVADKFAQQGKENTANRLSNLATQLIETHRQFLQEVLQATADSKGNVQLVYGLLDTNAKKLNDIFRELLLNWGTDILTEVEPDVAQFYAAVISNFSNLISQYPLGSPAKNMEIAITGHEINLTIFTRSAFPQDWAITKNDLGNVYCKRIKGDPANNIEQAIQAYTDALEVRTRILPVDWATTQNNLGIAYSKRIQGDKADNIEQAIQAYTDALEVRTRQVFPQQWAATQNNLGTAYYERIKGNRANNIELAIKAYTNALEVRNHETLPQEWAMTQDNLGNAYSERMFGDRVENIELAIKAYTNALTVRNRESLPLDWAVTQSNLALAYIDRIKEEKADNIEKAISTSTANLEVYTRVTLPQQWAITQNNLGIAYVERIKGNRAANIELAIKAYINALTVRTRESLPLDWAATQNNLGIAYRNRILGDRDDNREMAIAAYYAALEVYTRIAYPQNHAETLFNLGILYQDNKQFDLAYNTFAQAIETVEALRGEINSGEEVNRKQAEEWNQLYRRIVEVCIALKRDTEAIEYIERSKTRNLVELILNSDFKTIFPPELATQLEQISNKIASSQFQLQNNKAENPTALAQDIQQWRQQRRELQDSYLPMGFGFKFDQFQKTLDDNTVIIEWYIATDTILTFIIKPHGQQLTFLQSQPEDLYALFDWGNQYLQDYYNPQDPKKIQWQNQLAARLKILAEILHLEEILATLPKEFDRLILIPHLFLHLFPLHALPVKESYLMDLFPNGVSYAPSCQILQQVQMRQRPDFQSFFAIQNPTADLYQDYEKDLGAVAAIKQQFPSAYILKQAEAKKSAILHINENNHNVTLNKELLKANCIFFFCHGYFNPISPLESGLQLADENLTLTDIITHFKLENCRLVTLSACETGVTDFSNRSDEYIGLPSGFLLAGSTNVVSSLWTVSATATALLMIKFYEELQEQSNIILALNTAQRWLRDTTVKGFQDWLSNSSLSICCQQELDKYFTQIAKEQGESTKLFESPFDWAAFCTIGKGV